jgi:hypothetical protein
MASPKRESACGGRDAATALHALALLAMPGQPHLGLTAIAFISPQNHPILVRALSGSPEDLLKYHYVAHTSLDVIDERSKQHPTPPHPYP